MNEYTATNKSTNPSNKNPKTVSYNNSNSNKITKDQYSSRINPNFTQGSNDMNQETDHQEGTVTKKIENQTAKIPSGVYLSLAIGAMILSVTTLATRKNKGLSQFFGSWVTPLLVMGLYNKIVKTQGSD